MHISFKYNELVKSSNKIILINKFTHYLHIVFKKKCVFLENNSLQIKNGILKMYIFVFIFIEE